MIEHKLSIDEIWERARIKVSYSVLKDIDPEATIKNETRVGHLLELYKLASLGIWAEKHAIPALNYGEKLQVDEESSPEELLDALNEMIKNNWKALEELPKK